MQLEFISRLDFCVCGWPVETTLVGNDKDIAALYRDVFETGKERELLKLPGCQSGYYGLEWYTEGHNSFFYLLGKATDAAVKLPAGAVMRHVPAARYAVTGIVAGANLVDAWTEFFQIAIPEAGYAPDETHGIYFEFYPEDVHGACELWTPVIPRGGERP